MRAQHGSNGHSSYRYIFVTGVKTHRMVYIPVQSPTKVLSPLLPPPVLPHSISPLCTLLFSLHPTSTRTVHHSCDREIASVFHYVRSTSRWFSGDATRTSVWDCSSTRQLMTSFSYSGSCKLTLNGTFTTWINDDTLHSPSSSAEQHTSQWPSYDDAGPDDDH